MKLFKNMVNIVYIQNKIYEYSMYLNEHIAVL